MQTTRELFYTSRYKKDYKREAKGQYAQSLERELRIVIEVLLNNQRLPVSFRDHALAGEWIGHRDCHIKPDLVLIYQYPDAETLLLVRLGTHSELGF